MLTAMCVRKTGDADKSSSLTSSSSLALQGSKETLSSAAASTARKKLRGFKIAVGKKSSQTLKEKEPVAKEREEERVPPQKVQDDEDGHLIYRKGDYLDSRCKYHTTLSIEGCKVDLSGTLSTTGVTVIAYLCV